MKEIADSIGVNKMKVYRSITSNHYKEQYKNGQTLYFSETVKKLIEKDLVKETVTKNRNKKNSENNGELIDALKERISSQQQQIENLTRLLDQSQQLQLMAENKIKQLENKDDKSETEKLDKENPEPDKKGFWKNLFS